MMDDRNEELLAGLLLFNGSSSSSTEATDIISSSPPPHNSIGNGSAYCGQSLKHFGDGYRSIHGYTSLVVCVLGAVANILNLIVLTRKKMINPTNAILTGLALADLLNMVEYIPFVMYMYFLPDTDGTAQRKTYGWAVFVLAHSNFSQVCHTISIWLTVTLAVWRYIMVAMPMRSKVLCSMERAKWSILLAYLVPPILCISNYLTFSIRTIVPKKQASNGSSDGSELSLSMESKMDVTTEGGTSSIISPELESNKKMKFIVNLSDLAKNHPIIMTANFWLYSVVIKIIPCILLTVVSYRLINSLIEAKKRKDKLLAKKPRPSQSSTEVASSSAAGRLRGLFAGSQNSGEDSSGGSDRTTKMLIAVLLLFLITEFPQGLLALLSGLMGDAFFKSCYIPLADLMDFLALLNSAINFILYCTMSQMFRDTFYEVFYIDKLAKLFRRNGQQGGLDSNGRALRTPRSSNILLSPANRHLLPTQQETSVQRRSQV